MALYIGQSPGTAPYRGEAIRNPRRPRIGQAGAVARLPSFPLSRTTKLPAAPYAQSGKKHSDILTDGFMASPPGGLLRPPLLAYVA